MAVRDPSAVVTHSGDFESDMKNTKIPQALRFNLPQAMLNQITLYGLIHDINRQTDSIKSEDYMGFVCDNVTFSCEHTWWVVNITQMVFVYFRFRCKLK